MKKTKGEINARGGKRRSKKVGIDLSLRFVKSPKARYSERERELCAGGGHQLKPPLPCAAN